MSRGCPFHWREDPRPSIFASDPRFAALQSGKSRAERAAESIEEQTTRLGRSPGTIKGIERKAKTKATTR